MDNNSIGIEIESVWNDSNPSYSPDGKYLAFLSTSSGKSEIWLKDFSSGSLIQLTGEEDQYIESELTWSHDRQKIYFKFYQDNVYGIYYLEL